MRAFAVFKWERLFAGNLLILRLGVENDAIVLLVIAEDIAGKNLEGFAATLVENLIAHLVEIFRDVVSARLLLEVDLSHNTILSGVDGATDGARSHVEELRRHLAHRTEVGNLAAEANQFAGLHSGSKFLRSLVEIARGL